MKKDPFQKYFSEEDKASIAEAVQRAERGTQGEIVPMVVLNSSAVGHVPLLVTLTGYCLLLLMEVFFQWQKIWLLVAVFPVMFFVAQLISKLNPVQRFFVPQLDEQLQVWRRAQSEFSNHKLSETKHRVGILIFVSIMERRAVVLADEGIAKICAPETWQDVVQLLTDHFKRREWALGFEKAIGRCGEILHRHLPAQEQNPNEIPNRLILKP